MDRTQMDITFTTNQDHFEADKQRLASFRLGKERPSSKPNHGRSHSRNTSVSSLSTFSFPATNNSNDTSSSSSSPTRSSSASLTKRHSHHRRQSSVSTRRESAEVMGVSVPDLSPSNSDDNINLGDKDSIRRRALLALEGKSELGSFAKMEIPELRTPEVEKTTFSFPAKPSFPAGTGTGFGIGNLMNKRDSFGKSLLASVSLKEQLGTLLEEDEEEEEENDELKLETMITTSVSAPVIPVPFVTSTLSKTRPAKIRPLTLCGIPSVNVESGLPSPAYSPSPRPPVLKPLTLAQSPNVEEAPKAARRATMTGAPARPKVNAMRAKRAQSIGYKSGDSPQSVPAMLPTPEMTPVSDRRMSASSNSSSSSRESGFMPGPPLSVSEQHFLFKSHNALLTRIEDLERTLSQQRRDSLSSAASSNPFSESVPRSFSFPASELNDDMTQLVADLKAERDELRVDVDGWRNRVADGEKQAIMLVRRLESERRDAWVAREKASMLEGEKQSLTDSLATARAEGEGLRQEYVALQAERDNLLKQLADALESIEQERVNAAIQREALQARLDKEIARREELERELETAGLMATPTPVHFASLPTKPRAHGLGFQSIDSQATEVDDADITFEFKLKTVTEEDEEEIDRRATPEDESLASPASLTFSSGDEDEPLISSMSDIAAADSMYSRSASPSPSVESTHTRRHSLSKAWTFPTAPKLPSASKPKADVDHFFSCLDDFDNASSNFTLARTEESGKSLFCQLANADNDMPPFFLPPAVGIEVIETKTLDVLVEEDEGADDTFDPEDFGGEEVEGGIRFVFTPAPPSPSSSTFTPDEAGDQTFRFPQQLALSPSRVAIPSIAKPVFVPQPRSPSPRGTKPSFIPQPTRKATNAPSLMKRAGDASTFGSLHKTGAPTTSTPYFTPLSQRTPPTAHTFASSSYETPGALAAACRSPPPVRVSAISSPAVSPSLSSLPLSSRLSLQTFTNLIPGSLGWAVGASAVTSPSRRAPSFVSREKQLEKLRIRLEHERHRAQIDGYARSHGPIVHL